MLHPPVEIAEASGRCIPPLSWGLGRDLSNGDRPVVCGMVLLNASSEESVGNWDVSNGVRKVGS